MPADRPTRRDPLQLDAFDPVTRGTCLIQIAFERMQAVARRGMVQAAECAFIVPSILQHPTAVFEGIRRDEDETRGSRAEAWRCYCGIPTNSYRDDGTAAPPYEDEVFLVFIDSDRLAYNWRWERCDPDDPRLPENHKIRFRRRLL